MLKWLLYNNVTALSFPPQNNVQEEIHLDQEKSIILKVKKLWKIKWKKCKINTADKISENYINLDMKLNGFGNQHYIYCNQIKVIQPICSTLLFPDVIHNVG